MFRKLKVSFQDCYGFKLDWNNAVKKKYIGIFFNENLFVSTRRNETKSKLCAEKFHFR